LVFFLF